MITTPVSYTHLDVYKRQKLINITMYQSNNLPINEIGTLVHFQIVTLKI